MLVDAVLLAALAVEAEETADRHPRLVVLVEEAAGVPLHAEAAQPVPADRLAEAPAARVAGASSGLVGGGGASWAEVAGGREGGGIGDDERRRGGIGGAHLEAALEIEAERSVCVFHLDSKVAMRLVWKVIEEEDLIGIEKRGLGFREHLLKP